MQPIPGIRFAFRESWSGPLRDSLFGLAPDGFSVPRRLRFARALLPHLFTLAASNRLRRFDFLWHCPSKGLATFRPRVSQPNGLELRGIAPFGVRTFLF